MSTLYCQYDLGSDPLLVGNGFQYFLFLRISFNPRINKVIIIIIIRVQYGCLQELDCCVVLRWIVLPPCTGKRSILLFLKQLSKCWRILLLSLIISSGRWTNPRKVAKANTKTPQST